MMGYTPFSIIGTGHALPVNNVHNIEFATHLDTSDEWIVQRTGISSRRFVDSNETMTTLAAEAAGRALASSQRVACDLGLIILCTSTPDNLFGSASKIQHAIGAVNAASFDVTSACSGLAVGFNVAVHMLSSYRTVMVIGADTLSRFLDMNDRNTCVLFGDGASAVLLEVAASPSFIFHHKMLTKSEAHAALGIRLGASKVTSTVCPSYAARGSSAYGYVHMDGKNIFSMAVELVPKLILETCAEIGLKPDEVDHFILHQANKRIIDRVIKVLQICPEKCRWEGSDIANTSAASIGTALDRLIKTKTIVPGNLLLICGFGAGFTAAATVFRYNFEATVKRQSIPSPRKRPLIIFGTMLHGELAHHYFNLSMEYEPVAFAVDKEFLHGEHKVRHLGLPILPFESIETFAGFGPQVTQMYIALEGGNHSKSSLRQLKFEQAKQKGYTCASYVHPSASNHSKSVGENCLILENCVLQAFSEIGDNTTIWSGTHVGHHSSIKGHCFIASQCVISGRVTINTGCYLGVNCTIRDGVSLGAFTFVGMDVGITHSTDKHSYLVIKQSSRLSTLGQLAKEIDSVEEAGEGCWIDNAVMNALEKMLSCDKVDTNRAISEVGLDSLMFSELQDELRIVTGHTIPLHDLLGFSPSQIVEYIKKMSQE